MTCILQGFAGELLKLAAQAQNQQTDGPIPAQGIDSAIDKAIGTKARSGNKMPGGLEQQMAPRPPAPFAVTTPSRMTG